MYASLTFYLAFFMTGFISTTDRVQDLVPRWFARTFVKTLPPTVPLVGYSLAIVALALYLPLSALVATALCGGAVLYMTSRLDDLLALALFLVGVLGLLTPVWWARPAVLCAYLVTLALIFSLTAIRRWVMVQEWRMIGVIVVTSAAWWGAATVAQGFSTPHAVTAGTLFALTLYAGQWYDRLIRYSQQQSRSLRYANNHDELTGVFSLRQFRNDYTLYQKMLRSDPSSPLHLVMIDIDHFKTFNDTYGHLVGNEVLTRFAKDLDTYLVAKDYYCGVYRTGGEEFSVFLYSLSAAQARAEIDTYVQQLQALAIARSHPQLRITLSVGITACRGADESLQALISRADQNLYAAKRGGRNRIVAK